MENIKDLVDLVLQYGIIGFLIIVLLLIIHDPDRAEKLKALVLKPTFNLFKWGSKQYVASEVGFTVTEFFKRNVRGAITNLPEVKIRVKWVSSPSDPVLSNDGTLILRLTNTNDQTRNTLAATRLALPHIVYPTLRPYVQLYAQSAIDLTLLRKLAERLGRHARPIFQRYFLEPEIEEEEKAQQLFKKLIAIDDYGIFVTIFLEELNLLGEVLYASGDRADKTDEILSFLDFLVTLATRHIREKIPLEYITSEIRLTMVLLAISQRVLIEGVGPYLERIDRNIKLGCDSIYIFAYPLARSFLKRILTAIESDERLFIVKHAKVEIKKSVSVEEPGVGEIVLLRTNKVFLEGTFEGKLVSLGLNKGDKVQGTVIDVSKNTALVDVSGLNATITNKECSWQTIDDCGEILAVGATCEFMIQEIDKDRCKLLLSLLFPESDPWKSEYLPNEGDVIDVEIFGSYGINYLCRYREGIEIFLPFQEVSWLKYYDTADSKLLNTTQKIIIIEKDNENRILKGSMRRLEKDPWPQIFESFPKGTELRATVLEVTPTCVKVELPGGFVGIIPRGAMIQGGYEYADYEKSLVTGQGIDVVVTKVFINKRRIRLDLKRNI